MSPLTPARAYILITIGMACLMGLLGGLLGWLIDAWNTGLLAGLIAAAFTAVGAFLNRGRGISGYEKTLNDARNAAMQHGYSAGVAQYVLITAANYEAAVFPHIADGVATEERTARRSIAYKIAAREDVPEPVRKAAADALAALDAADLQQVTDTMKTLAGAVYAHHTSSEAPHRPGR